MAKHTPGPWYPSDRSLNILADKPNRKAICTMRNVHDDDAESNKRLIAAAPALLEAARELLYAIEELESMEAGAVIKEDTRRQARAAISAALDAPRNDQ